MRNFIEAVQQDRVEAVRDYLDAGADPNLQDPTTGESVLALAAARGNMDIVSALLDAGADPNFLGTTAWPLNNAAGEGHLRVVQILLEADAEVECADADGVTALGVAAAKGDANVVSLLLEAGADPRRKDGMGNRPIILAAQNGHQGVVDILKPLSTSRDRQQVELLLQLSLQGPPNEKVRNYFTAAERGDIATVKSYLEHGGDVDAMEEDGRTAVFRAAHRGRLEILKLLVEYGADLNHIDSYGSYPLVTAGQTRDAGDPAYDFVYDHTSEELRKDWEGRVKRAKKIARERGYL